MAKYLIFETFTLLGFYLFAFDYSFYIAILFVFAVGYLSYRLELLDLSGVISGIILGLLIIVFTDIVWFLVFLIFFILGGAFTRYKYNYKESLGIAQKDIRNYKNVLGNGFVPLCMVFGYQFNPIFIFGFFGAIATATADTLATEIGETSSGKPRMITNFKPVKPGTNGGISFLGELSAILGSVIIAFFIVFMDVNMSVIPWLAYIATIFGGFIGTNFDSLLGATLEERGYLTNNTVNLFATLFGGLVSIFIYILFV